VALSLAAPLARGHGAGEQAGHANGHAHHDPASPESSSPPAGSQAGYQRSLASYAIPDVALISSEGREVSLKSALNRRSPVIVNFIFTTCTSICPVMSATFSQLRRELGHEAEGLRLISISIDPEHDTPARLEVYARRYQAGPDWQFLTGERSAIQRVQDAFDAYRGPKVNHVPLTFLRATTDAPWVRIDGFASAADLAREYRHLTAE
jgi:protein SCO1/2